MQHIVYKTNLEKYGIDIEKAYKQLSANGFARFKVGEISKDDFLNFCYNFGEVIPSGRNRELIDDILTGRANGAKGLPLHTDKSYWRLPPRYEILYVNDIMDMGAGEITVSDLLAAFEQLPEEIKSALLSVDCCYNAPTNRDRGYNRRARFITVIDGEIELFRYRLDLFTDSTSAIERFSAVVEQGVRLIPYEKGDILILDNWCHAAGRNVTEWGVDGRRHLFRALVV